MTSNSDATTTSGRMLDIIRSRRVTREFADLPVSVDDIRQILEAGRWASSASNRRVHRFLVVRDQGHRDLIRKLSPGMATVPPVLVAICTDLQKMEAEGVQADRDPTTMIDVGTAVMNMMIAAEAIGLGSCPVTSFSPAGVSTILNFPEYISPDLLLMLGHRRQSPTPRIRQRMTYAEISDWEYIGGRVDEEFMRDE